MPCFHPYIMANAAAQQVTPFWRKNGTSPRPRTETGISSCSAGASSSGGASIGPKCPGGNTPLLSMSTVSVSGPIQPSSPSPS